MKIILASASPRRKEILSMAGVDFQVVVSDVDENIKTEKPGELPLKLSGLKALDVFNRMSDEEVIVIGADTVVAVDDEIFGKPADHDDFVRMMKKISGREHHVYTGVTMVMRKKDKVFDEAFVSDTLVYVDELDDFDIEKYYNCGESMDKAGGYAIQGHFSKHIKGLSGDYYNVVGLPINPIWKILKQWGVEDC